MKTRIMVLTALIALTACSSHGDLREVCTKQADVDVVMACLRAVQVGEANHWSRRRHAGQAFQDAADEGYRLNNMLRDAARGQ